jgi:hypothetical protein
MNRGCVRAGGTRRPERTLNWGLASGPTSSHLLVPLAFPIRNRGTAKRAQPRLAFSFTESWRFIS